MRKFRKQCLLPLVSLKYLIITLPAFSPHSPTHLKNPTESTSKMSNDRFPPAPSGSTSTGPGPSLTNLAVATAAHAAEVNQLLGNGEVRTDDHSMEDVVVSLDQVAAKLSTRGEVLQPGLHLPSFKKGFLDDSAALDVLKQFVNKAAVLISKKRAAEKVLSAVMQSPSGFYGKLVIDRTKVTLSGPTVTTLDADVNALLTRAIVHDKTETIRKLDHELSFSLPEGLAKALEASLVSIDTNPALNTLGKNFAKQSLSKVITEFQSQVQMLHVQQELQQLQIITKVKQSQLYKSTFLQHMYNYISNLYLLHVGQEGAFETQGQGEEDGFRSPTSRRFEEIQRPQEGTQETPSREQKGKRKAKGHETQWSSSTKSKVQRIPVPRKEDPVPLQEKVIGVNNISHIIDIPEEVLSVLNKGVNFNLHKKSCTEKFYQEYVSIQKQLIMHIGVRNRRLVAIYTNALKPALIRDLTLLDDNNPHRCLLPQIRHTINFMKSHNLLVCPADKNMGLTILQKEWYMIQLHLIVSNEENYLPCPTFCVYDCLQSLEHIHNSCNSFTREIRKLYITIKKNIDKDINHYKVPVLYLLPKIHKNPIGARPIVPSHSWLTTTVSEFVDKELRSFLTKFSWDLPDTPTLIRHLESYKFDASQLVYIMAYDVINMYGNIDIDEAVTFIKDFHKSENETSRRRLGTLLWLAKWVNDNCILVASTTTYRQIKGLAMGTPMAPTVARLFACCVEKSNTFSVDLTPNVNTSDDLRYFYQINRLSKATTHIFRYIDDGFAIFMTDKLNNTQLDHFDREDILFCMSQSIHRIYSKCNSINVTVDHSPNGLNAVMLDLNVKVVPVDIIHQKFQVEPYDKPTNKHLYANPSTYYPAKYIFNWINGENQRLIRNSSTEPSYLEALSNFTSHLLSREYPVNTIQKQLQKHSYLERNDLLDPYPADEEKNATKKVYIHNIAGRHKLEQFGRDIVQLHGESNSYNWITYRGSNLLGVVSKYNKEALSS